MKSKTAKVEALTESIEEKTKCIGNLGVKIVGMKEELSDAEESLLEDKKFLGELEKGCATKEKEWAEICKLRSEELLALSDTIKISMMMMHGMKLALPGSVFLKSSHASFIENIGGV